MGVVHLAQAPRRLPGRAQGAAPARHRRRRGPRAAGPRGRLAAPGDAAPASPRSSTPTRGARRRTSPPATSPASRCTSTSARRGRSPATTSPTSPPGSPRRSIAVHQVGVLHRDIKPSNVLLEGRAPVLIDFGLARLAEDPRLTQTGWLLGTPGYLAPEILYGDDATTASDVHSLGGDRGVRRHRPAAVRHRPGDGDHGPGPPRRARPLRACPRRCCRCCEAASRPTPPTGPTPPRPALRAARGPRPARPRRDRAGAGRATTRRCRSRSPRPSGRPSTTTPPTCSAPARRTPAHPRR